MLHLTAQLLLPQSLLLLLRCLQGGRTEVGHDHEELLEADLFEGARLALVLIPASQNKIRQQFYKCGSLKAYSST